MTISNNSQKEIPQKLVAIVVPLSNRDQLTPGEEVSLKHLTHYLGKYDKYFLMPESLRFERPGFKIERFSDKYFGSADAHLKLLFSPKLYERFIDYKYILIYQLDALVFSDQLKEWCDRDFDFIGAPWIKHKDAVYYGNPAYEGKVGNSGFALKKVESFLKIFNSKRYSVDPTEYKEQLYKTNNSKKISIYVKKWLKHLKMFNGVKWELARYKLSEERFLVSRGSHYYPGFNIAPLETALEFSFECVPRYCYEQNNYRLPFGCHAWQRYDEEFWKPYLLK